MRPSSRRTAPLGQGDVQPSRGGTIIPSWGYRLAPRDGITLHVRRVPARSTIDGAFRSLRDCHHRTIESTYDLLRILQYYASNEMNYTPEAKEKIKELIDWMRSAANVEGKLTCASNSP